jgi:tRNA threonylcarbamoyladenosine biosynthesis protein TsaE
MTLSLATHSATETIAVGAAVGRALRVGDLVVLAGDLGAGKTTFVKGIARALGVTEPVTSPTFTIVQEYDGTIPLAHVDVYRLDRIQEVHDVGFEELFDRRAVVVEWGEAIARVLPRDRLVVRLDLRDDGADDDRDLVIVAHGPSWNARMPGLEQELGAVGTA